MSENVRGSPTLLVIEDAVGVRRTLCALAHEMRLFQHVLSAEDGFEALRLLADHEVDIVLCDLRMPRCDGLEFLKRHRQTPATARVPVIVLSGADDERTRITALESGASDYITKPAHPQEMRARLAVHLRLKQMRDELERNNRDLERLTRLDPLTGLFNRRHLDEVLAAEHARSVRYRRPFSLLLLDVDHFKQINDTHGHQAGDRVLHELASFLVQQVRCHDIVARFGGEEFGVLLPETSGDQAVVVAERLRGGVAQRRVEWLGKQLRITVSVGISSLTTDSRETADDLVAAADTALYAAKRAGRDRVIAAWVRPEPPQRT